MFDQGVQNFDFDNYINGNNNTIDNNMIQELPKTGTSIWEYAAYILVLSVVLWGIGMYLNNKKIIG